MNERNIRRTALLSMELARRNVRAKFRYNALGYAWLFLTPLLMAAAWVFLRRAGNIVVGDVDGSYPMYVAIGMFLWQTFGRIVQSSLQQLNSNRHLLGKFAFRWEALILAGWLEVAFEFAVGLVAISLVLLATGTLSFAAPLSVPFMLCLLAFGGAVGLLLAPLGMLYGDVGRLIGLALSLFFFLVPIVYPVGTSALARLAVASNPAAVFLVVSRDFLLTGTTEWLTLAAVYAGATALLLAAGFALLRVAQPHLAARA